MANAPAITPQSRNPQQVNPTALAVQQLLGANMKAIQSCLPKHMTPERMCRVAFSTVTRTPSLLKCTPQSLVAAIVEASSLGLEIDSRGLAYLVPFWNKNLQRKEAKLMTGYKGFMQLAYNSGRVTNIYAEVVCEKDTFEFAMGLDAKLVHIPNLEDRGPLRAAYAVARVKDADAAFVVMGKSEIMKIKAASQGGNKDDSPWIHWEEEMWKKSAIRRLCKYLPLSPEMQRAVSLDEMADAGNPQDLAVGLIDLDPQDKGDDGQPAAVDLAALDRFNKQVAAALPDEDMDAFGEFLEATAKANGSNINQVKTAAADRFDEIKNAFYAWKAKNASAAPAGHPCADDPDIRVSAETCRKCNSFPACVNPHPDTK
jgi:recombination protein RecT